MSLNILYQSYDLEKTTVSKEALKNLQRNADWFVPALGKFLSSSTFPNVFYLALVRDALKQAKNKPEKSVEMLEFVQNLLDVCRVDKTSSETLIK